MKKFNKDKYLRKIKVRRWLQNYSKYLYLELSCILVCVLGIYFTFSKFFVSKEEEVVRTTVAPFIAGDVVIGAYVNGEYSQTVPGKNDGYVVDKVVCDNDAVGKWNNDDWGLLINNLSKRSKCNIYFKKGIKIADTVTLVDTTGKCPTVNEDGSVNVTDGEATDGYLCSAKDAYGTSYYYRGNVTNNYVKFADKYWRIVRINGDGSVRIVYDGTSAHANGESSNDRQIGSSSFNSGYNDNAYIGYMYGNKNEFLDGTGTSLSIELSFNINYHDVLFYVSNEYTYDAEKKLFVLKNPIEVEFNSLKNYIGYYITYYGDYTSDYLLKIYNYDSSSSPYESVYGSYVGYITRNKEEAQTNTNDSTVKKYLDNWYKSNILNTSNEQYLADNIFCNNRSISSNGLDGYSNKGYGIEKTLYNWYNDPWYDDLKMNLICSQQNDAFTVKDTSLGNGALTYSIGLLTEDEIVLAGGGNDSNSGYYLYSGQWWWSLSPYSFDGTFAVVRIVRSDIINFSGNVNEEYGVRPVLNLKANVLAYGTGTAKDPYRLADN